MTRCTYDRYCDPKVMGVFRAPDLGSINPDMQQRVLSWKSDKDTYFVEFTGTYPLTEVQLLLREHGLRDYPRDVSLLRKLPKGHIRSDVIRFWYNIELHYSLPYPQLISKEDLWRRAFDEGSDFANWLDDLFSYGYRNAYGSDFTAPDEFIGIHLENYSSVFPPCFLPRIEEETIDMRKWMTTSPTYNERIRREVLFEIEKIIRSCEKLYIPHFKDIVANIKDTVCYYDGIKYKPYQLPLYKHCEISSEYIGYESKILVYPSGMRDTVILEKPSSNMIRICEKIFLSIIDSCEESIYGINGDRLRESLNFFSEQEEGYHVLRDIKKCGLTVPINIYINDIQDILYKYFPNGPWNALDIYKNIKIKLVDGTWLEPKRGVGLGMANNLTTLLCIAVHRLAKRYFYKYNSRDIFIVGRIGNDDSDIYIRGDIENARDYLLYERDILTDAGFVVNIKKTYISRYYHLFEEYQHENFKYKESLAVGMLVRSLLEKNLRTAKYMAIEAQKLAPTMNIYGIIESIALSRPYEFDVNELNRPFWLGGWLFKRLDGRYLGLDSLATALLHSNRKVYRAFRVIQEFHRSVTSMKDHEILSKHDNSNYVWRRAGFFGEAPKGNKGFYNYSLSENYKHMCNMWKIKHLPHYKISLLNTLYKKKYELDYSKNEYITLCVKSCLFYNDISMSSKYLTLYETPLRSYQIPLKAPFKACEAAYVSRPLAGMLETLPKCISDIHYASEYYHIFQYDSVATSIDPQGKRNYLRFAGLISGDEQIIEPIDVIDVCAQVEEILGRYNIILYPVRKEWLFQRYVSNAYAYLMRDGEQLDDALVIEREEFSNYWSFLDSKTSEELSDDSEVRKEEFWHLLEGGDPNDLIKRLRSPIQTDVSSTPSRDHTKELISVDFSPELLVNRLKDLGSMRSSSSNLHIEDYSESVPLSYETTKSYLSEIYAALDDWHISDNSEGVEKVPSPFHWSMIETSAETDVSNLDEDYSTSKKSKYSQKYNAPNVQDLGLSVPCRNDMYEKSSSCISYVARESTEAYPCPDNAEIQALEQETESCSRIQSISEISDIPVYDRDRDYEVCPSIMESPIDSSSVWVQLIRRRDRFFLMSKERQKELLKKEGEVVVTQLVESSVDTSDVWVWLIRRTLPIFLVPDDRIGEALREAGRRIDEEFGLYDPSQEVVIADIFYDDGESYPYVDDRHLELCIRDFDAFCRNRKQSRVQEFAQNVNDLWCERTYGRKDNYPVNHILLTKARELLIELKLIELSEELSEISFDMHWMKEKSVESSTSQTEYDEDGQVTRLPAPAEPLFKKGESTESPFASQLEFCESSSTESGQSAKTLSAEA